MSIRFLTEILFGCNRLALAHRLAYLILAAGIVVVVCEPFDVSTVQAADKNTPSQKNKPAQQLKPKPKLTRPKPDTEKLFSYPVFDLEKMKAAIRADFLALAVCPSPSGQEKIIAVQITQKLQDLSIQPLAANLPLKHPKTPHYVIEPASGSIIIYLPGSYPTAPVILWDTHMDTVNVGMTPATQRINVLEESGGKFAGKDDVIFKTAGNKTALGGDAKTSIAATFEFLRQIAQPNWQKLNRANTIIAITTEEETGAVGAKKIPAAYLAYGKEIPQFIVAMDFEGSPNTIVRQAPQMIRFTASVSGKSSHAAMNPQPGPGVNPLPPLLHFLNQFPIGYGVSSQGEIDTGITGNIGGITTNQAPVQSSINSPPSSYKQRPNQPPAITLAKPSFALQQSPFPKSTASPSSAGGMSNIYPQRVDTLGEIRSLNRDQALKNMQAQQHYFEQEVDGYNQFILTQAKQLGVKNPALVRSQFEIIDLFNAYETPEDNRYLQLLKRLLEQELGLPGVTFKSTNAGSDANVFRDSVMSLITTNAKKSSLPTEPVPTVVLGAGYYNAHTANEFASLNDMVSLAQLQLFLTTSLHRF